MAVTMGDERIGSAHQNAARSAFIELQQFAAARVRTEGQTANRTTGNVIGAQFLHNSSRALDPQLHTHFVVFNATYDQEERRWKALEASRMFDAIKYGTEVYRNELAKQLLELGYEMERRGNGFEIKGVSDAVLKQFSKRAGERDRAVRELEKKLGRKLSNNEISHVIHKTRSKKLKGISEQEVRQFQCDQLSETDRRSLQAIRDGANGRSKAVPRHVTEQAALDYAIDHVFERQSVVAQHQLLYAGLNHGRGQVDLGKLKSEFESSTRLVRVGEEYSTREILQSELHLINAVETGKNSATPVSPASTPLDRELGTDQRNAVSFILKSRDQITGIRGLAGTGKSRTLKELFRAYNQAQFQPILCAPTGSAAENLRKDGLPATTLQKFFADPKLQSELSPQSVLVLDEAGMVGTEEMRKLFDLAKEKQARVVLCGDTAQHTSVTRGDALRILESHSSYSFAELTEIRRQQKAPKYLEAVREASARQPGKAFELLDKIGAIVETQNVYEQASAEYLNCIKSGKTSLLVSPTWKEISALTDRIRQSLKQHGIVSQREQSVAVVESLAWTKAEKKSVQHYHAGQLIVIQRNQGRFARHEHLQVLGIGNGKKSLQVRRADGTQAEFQPVNPESFDVGQAKEIGVAPGDQLLLQAPHKTASEQFVNGEIVRVKDLTDSGINLADGRTLPAEYRTFTHGYAVTSQTAQSKSVDKVFVVASSKSLPGINRREFYVDISRGKEACRIFTDDKQMLRNRIGDPRDRKSAIELSGLEQALIKNGLIAKPTKDKKISPPATSRFCNSRRLANVRLSPAERISQLAHRFSVWTEKLGRTIGQSLGLRSGVRLHDIPQQSQRKGIRI